MEAKVEIESIEELIQSESFEVDEEKTEIDKKRDLKVVENLKILVSVEVGHLEIKASDFFEMDASTRFSLNLDPDLELNLKVAGESIAKGVIEESDNQYFVKVVKVNNR